MPYLISKPETCRFAPHLKLCRSATFADLLPLPKSTSFGLKRFPPELGDLRLTCRRASVHACMSHVRHVTSWHITFIQRLGRIIPGSDSRGPLCYRGAALGMPLSSISLKAALSWELICRQGPFLAAGRVFGERFWAGPGWQRHPAARGYGSYFIV